MGSNTRISSIDEINRREATTENYINVNLGIKKTDEEKRNLISATFGVIKSNMNAFWYAVGLDMNVTKAYDDIKNDPAQSFEVNGKIYYAQSGVGKMKPYNELGNPSGGAYTTLLLG